MAKLKSAANPLTSCLLLIASTGAYAVPCSNISSSDPNQSPIVSVCDNQTISILAAGAITANTYGISTSGSNVRIENSGTITTHLDPSTFDYSHGIQSLGNQTTIINSGTIITSGDETYGIYAQEDYNAIITNSGRIVTNDINSHGIYAVNSQDAIITNSGSINTSGSFAHGIYAGNSQDAIITNSGSINTIGPIAVGIFSLSGQAIITNSGSITTTGIALNVSNGADGIFVNGAQSTINNSGIIKIKDINSAAIHLENAENSTVNLNRGSVIVGNIVKDHASSAKLNINLGAGVSYAYSVTGPWTITDLDNRPMVTGSAYAAGIGAQETASEMLYQRTSVVTKALDNRVYAYALNESNVQPYWLDVYYGDTSRDAGANYSTRTKFSHDHYGFTVGLTLPVEVIPLELIVNAEHSNLNIDNGSQKIDSDSIMAGILAPKLTEIAGATLSAKAMLGYSNHDGDRKVMSNSQLYDGSYQIKSDYDSYYAVLGASALKPIPINDQLTASVLVGLDLNTQHTESYAEQDFASWNSRTLTQLQSRVQAGFDYRCNEKTHLFGRVGLERRDLISGDTQDYILHNASVSFNANNSNDTYVTGQLGIRSQLEKRIQLIGTISGLRSTDTVSNIQGNIGIRADF